MTFNGSTHPTTPNQVSIIGSSLSVSGAATFASSVTAKNSLTLNKDVTAGIQ